MHGYELRTRLKAVLGSFRAFSYGSLYPSLRRMREAGWITEEAPDPGATAPALTGRRGKVVYRLTAEGKEHLEELLAETGPKSYDDEGFGVHFAFFAQTDAEVRLRILEGRRRRVEERRDGLRTGLARTREKLDRYTLQLQEHGLDAVEREVRWLSELIDTERSEQAGTERSEQAGTERSEQARARRSRRAARSETTDRPREAGESPRRRTE
jgi:DNA-binding PadR family transcriptional regulator